MCQMTCRVDSLVAGTVVQFNVIATNSVGDSKPSETSPMYYVIGDTLVVSHTLYIIILMVK